MRIIIRQVCVPDYRVGLFRALGEHFGNLKVVSGPDYFTETVRSAVRGEAWSVRRRTWFCLGRRFAWLEPMNISFDEGSIIIHEWNPRILSLWRDWMICRGCGAAFVVWGHAWGKGGAKGLAFRFRHWVARRADGVICYTESQAKLTRQMNPGLTVIAAPNACLPRTACRVSGDEGTRDRVIYVGRIVDRKKVGLLIEGFAHARRKHPEFCAKLLIVGDGPERPFLEMRARELGLAELITWSGHQSDIEILRAAYAQAFVSVSPGYVGLSLTQSFAFGVPALISRNEPHSPEIEAALEGVNARFFASNSVNDLAEKLHGAWREWRGIAGQRRRLSAWTAENYSFEKMAEAFCDISSAVRKRKIRADL